MNTLGRTVVRFNDCVTCMVQKRIKSLIRLLMEGGVCCTLCIRVTHRLGHYSKKDIINVTMRSLLVQHIAEGVQSGDKHLLEDRHG